MKRLRRAKPSKQPLSGERLFRSQKFQHGYGDPYDDIHGRSNQDGIDRSELDVADTHQTPIDQDFTEDYEGDEDFYGDDEENQTGYSSYTGDQQRYLGTGGWVDQRYGENQYNHSPNANDKERTTRKKK